MAENDNTISSILVGETVFTLDDSTKMSKTNPTGTGTFSMNGAHADYGYYATAFAGYAKGVHSFCEAAGSNPSTYLTTAASATDTITVASNIGFLPGMVVEVSGSGAGIATIKKVNGTTLQLSRSITAAIEAHVTLYQGIAYGQYSHAEGTKTTASGDYSHAEGAFTVAGTADYTHAEGHYTQALGESSHAEGDSTIASEINSHAEGGQTIASGTCAHAEGYQTKASSLCAHAEGFETIALSNYSHAEGSSITATTTVSTTISSKKDIPVASVDDILVGSVLKVGESYVYVTAITGSSSGGGTVTVDTKVSATAGDTIYIFKGGVSYGEYSHTEGSSIALNNFSHAEGYQSISMGYGSHAEGYTTWASGYGAHAEGSATTAYGIGAHSEGHSSYAWGNSAYAGGESTYAYGFVQHVFGAYNEEDLTAESVEESGTYIEIVGNGTGDEERSNARTLDWSGNEVLSGTLTAKTALYLTDISSGASGGIIARDSEGIMLAYSYTDSSSVSHLAGIMLDSGETAPLWMSQDGSTTSQSYLALTGVDNAFEATQSPSTTNTYDLGSSDKQWNNVYSKVLYENGTTLENKYLPLSAGSDKPLTGDLYLGSGACHISYDSTDKCIKFVF